MMNLKERNAYFLSSEENEHWHRFRSDKQRRAWLAGRICLKSLWLHSCGNNSDNGLIDENAVDWTTMNIISRNDKGEGVRPILYVDKKPIDRYFSLSHSDFGVLAVLSKQKNRHIGCDIVPVGSFSDRFSQKNNPFVFHSGERRLLREGMADHIWAVKEAVYKATSHDKPFAPIHWVVEHLENNVFVCRSSEPGNDISVVVPTRLHDGHVFAVAVINSDK